MFVVVVVMATTSTQPGVNIQQVSWIVKIMCQNKPRYQDAAARLQAAY